MDSTRWSRRSVLGLAGLGFAAARAQDSAAQTTPVDHRGHGGHMGLVGRVSHPAPDPATYLRAWNFSDLPAAARSQYAPRRKLTARHCANI